MPFWVQLLFEVTAIVGGVAIVLGLACQWACGWNIAGFYDADESISQCGRLFEKALAKTGQWPMGILFTICLILGWLYINQVVPPGVVWAVQSLRLALLLLWFLGMIAVVCGSREPEKTNQSLKAGG